MAQTVRNIRWWESQTNAPKKGAQGNIASPAGRPGVVIACPKCGTFPVVYNGNYFCDNWNFPAGPDDCDWALGHPAKSRRDRDICDVIGIDYW